MIYKALDVARYIINYSCKIDKKVTNLKLQKLLYYVQAAFLQEQENKCFEDELLNWDYGPVVRAVYDEFKYLGSAELDFQESYKTIEFDENIQNIKMYDKKFDETLLKDDDKSLIDKVIESYRDKDAFFMVKKTHEEEPWKETKRNNYIETECIRTYYCKYPEMIYGEINK